MGSLTNALRILGQLDGERGQLSVTALAETLGLPKSTVSRSLKDLAAAGFLERPAGSRQYEPGYELFRLGMLYKSQHLPIDRIDRSLSRLAARFPATGYIAVLRGLDAVILRVQEGTHPVRFVQREGASLPAFVTAVGKALLARLSDHELDELLPKTLSFAPLSYRSTGRQLRAELSRYRERGWAELKDSAWRGIDALAVALRPSGREPIGCALCYMQATVSPGERNDMLDGLLGLAREVGPALNDPEWASLAAPVGSAASQAGGGRRRNRRAS